MKNNKLIIISYCVLFININLYSQQSKLSTYLDSQITQLHRNSEFSGTVLYSKNNNVIFQKGYGFANRELKLKNAPKYKYNLGSINKLFTKIAIARLIQEKKLSLNDLAKDFVPELHQKDTDKITIYQLLSMTSGYGDYLSDSIFINNKSSFKQMKDYLPIILNKELEFEPGSQRRYSNIGFELLGIIVERASEMNYYDFVQKYIFNIANMSNTGYYTQEDIKLNLAVGYTKRNEKYIPNWNLKSYKGTAAGGGYSTTEDMLQFSLSLLNYRLLDKTYTTLLFNKFDKNRTNHNYLSVAGGGPGINTRIFINRNDSEVVVIFSNIDPPSASTVNEIFKQMASIKQ